MFSSPEITELAKALSAAQGEMVPAKKTAENPFFKSKYADLASVWDVCRGPLTKNGLSIVQTTSVHEEGETLLRTILLHSSGQWLESHYPVNPVKTDPQGLGSAMTYARRYTLMAMVGIAPEDDDAEGAMDRMNSKAKPTTKPKASEAQIRKIHATLKDSGMSEDAYRKLLNKTFGVKSSKELDIEQASKLIEMLIDTPTAKAKPGKDQETTPPTGGKTEEVLQYVADQMKFKNTATARQWLEKSMKIDAGRIDSEPEAVLKEVSDLQGWNL